MNNKTEKVVMLYTEQCYGNPNQPRKYFNQQELEDLASSIKESGQLQPGKVRPDGKSKYMIIIKRLKAQKCWGSAQSTNHHLANRQACCVNQLMS